MVKIDSKKLVSFFNLNEAVGWILFNIAKKDKIADDNIPAKIAEPKGFKSPILVFVSKLMIFIFSFISSKKNLKNIIYSSLNSISILV